MRRHHPARTSNRRSNRRSSALVTTAGRGNVAIRGLGTNRETTARLETTPATPPATRRGAPVSSHLETNQIPSNATANANSNQMAREMPTPRSSNPETRGLLDRGPTPTVSSRGMARSSNRGPGERSRKGRKAASRETNRVLDVERLASRGQGREMIRRPARSRRRGAKKGRARSQPVRSRAENRGVASSLPLAAVVP